MRENFKLPVITYSQVACFLNGKGQQIHASPRGGYSPNMVNGGVPLKWVTFSQKIPKHGVWFHKNIIFLE